jgi:RNA-directed DNA polymerase
MLTEPIFEQEFHPGSYGYRPGRNCHGAIRAVNKALYEGNHWVIELDIKGFFDNIPHAPLREMFSRRISDGVLNRLVLGWLKAGVMKGQNWEASEAGTPQGGIVSPLLANLYLHEVLDQWAETQVRPTLRGTMELIRYADDAVLCFSNEADARKVLEVLPKRFGKYGLTLHPDKTKLVDFRPPRRRKDGKSESYDFLGFTLYWGKSRRGFDTVKLKTQQKRYAKGLKAITEACRRQRHEPMKKQQENLRARLQGHIAYYGVSHNYDMIEGFVRESVRIWHKWLNRRGSPKRLKIGKLWKKIEKKPWVKVKIGVSIY